VLGSEQKFAAFSFIDEFRGEMSALTISTSLDYDKTFSGVSQNKKYTCAGLQSKAVN